jgi:hypothetical protein
MRDLQAHYPEKHCCRHSPATPSEDRLSMRVSGQLLPQCLPPPHRKILQTRRQHVFWIVQIAAIENDNGFLHMQSSRQFRGFWLGAVPLWLILKISELA